MEAPKRCKRCGESKPTSEFYARDASCKTCRCAYATAYRLANPELIRERKRAWKKTDAGRDATIRQNKNEAGRARIKRYRQSERYNEVAAAYTKRLRKREPEKVAAREAVKAALKSGKLSRQSCEHSKLSACAGPIHAHHPSYERAHWLDVVWLCQVHHDLVHQLDEQEG